MIFFCHVGSNSISAVSVAEVTNTVYASPQAIKQTGNRQTVVLKPAVYASPQAIKQTGNRQTVVLKPAVPISELITLDYLVCLEDGKKLKMLKRHIRAVYVLTPKEYRMNWGLPADYPMVALTYAKQRSNFAKQIGLGRKKGEKVGSRKKAD